jgi:hypothetical protein
MRTAPFPARKGLRRVARYRLVAPRAIGQYVLALFATVTAAGDRYIPRAALLRLCHALRRGLCHALRRGNVLRRGCAHLLLPRIPKFTMVHAAARAFHSD